MKTTRQYAEGYIEKRQVLLDGTLPRGSVDADKPQKTMYFYQIDTPGFRYGPLRDTAEEAKADGRAECEKSDLHVPCFYTTDADQEELRRHFGL